MIASLNLYSELKARSHSIHGQFPASIVYRHEEASALFDSEGSSSMLPVVTLLRLALDHLQTHFLLERLALKHGQTDNRSLIDISREILQLTLVLWTQRDRFQAKRYNLEWMVCSRFDHPSHGPLEINFHSAGNVLRCPSIGDSLRRASQRLPKHPNRSSIRNNPEPLHICGLLRMGSALRTER